MTTCYQCGKPSTWLAADSRCPDCTRLTPEEVRGEVLFTIEDEEDNGNL